MHMSQQYVDTQEKFESHRSDSEPALGAPPIPAPARSVNPHQIAAAGFGRAFGLHPGVAVLTVAVDMMLHAADVMSAGLLIPFSFGGGVVLGLITFLAQRKWYGDDADSATIKALIVAVLTAIPSPLPYVLFVPAGIVGFFHSLRRRS
jgi:hypothetical protein